jgi:hypothetical protein
VYTKEKVGIYGTKWKRHVLDVFGHPCQLSNIGTGNSGNPPNYTESYLTETGPGHHIVCADFDGDGTDEFLIALMGYYPHQVYAS